jgi:hypothetical protein
MQAFCVHSSIHNAPVRASCRKVYVASMDASIMDDRPIHVGGQPASVWPICFLPQVFAAIPLHSLKRSERQGAVRALQPYPSSTDITIRTIKQRHMYAFLCPREQSSGTIQIPCRRTPTAKASPS